MSTVEDVQAITVRGAREHNLKNVHISIPRDQLVVVTGLSGSGKSSLAFVTVYAEGQRRYVECMSTYARQFLGMMKKPDVDVIDGLSPAISIEQKTVGSNPRSTVGTITEIYDYLRLLYARVGTQFCVECNIPVRQQTLDQIVDAIMTMGTGKRIQVLTPLVSSRKGHYRELFDQYRRQGYTRVRVDGEVQDIVEGMQLPRYKVHTIELVVDRLTIASESVQRLRTSVEAALHLGEGGVIVLVEQEVDVWTDVYFSTSYACPSCGTSYETPSPMMFSFNSPVGACPECDGLGERQEFDLELIIPDPNRSIAEGGITLLGKRRDTWLWKQVLAYCTAEGIDVQAPIGTLSDNQCSALLDGTGAGERKTVRVQYGAVHARHDFLGILPTMRHQLEHASTAAQRKAIEKYLATQPCRACDGTRLKQTHRAILIAGQGIDYVVGLDIDTCYDWCSHVLEQLDPRQQRIAEAVVKEIITRLNFLREIGLGYVTLDRASRTLSGGESQRIRLASQIGSQLVGVTYVLDEPSIGLHQHDNQRLIVSLQRLRDLGNSVIVVEHDRDMIESCDHVVDVGPGAGVHGGSIVAQFDVRGRQLLPGRARELEQAYPDSMTLQYLSGRREVRVPDVRRTGSGSALELYGARGHNLRNVDLRIPLGTFTVVTGMSGSGKSSLITDTLYPILARQFSVSEAVPLPYDRIEGLEHIDKVIDIDQSPIGRTPRSNPATYTGLFTLIRDFYTLLPEAKIRGYTAGRFSFNVEGGRCEECQGAGIRKIEMSFLPDVFVACESCNGKRYNMETLSVRFKGHSIADVLDLTVEEALEVFVDIPKIRKKLQALYDVGLTYIHLGQQAPTLSGGEAQRVKLATELSRTSTGKTLYVLDEPTTGLHFEDIRVLLDLLDRLVDRGNTVVVIEHNMDVIVHADHVVDLGPRGGQHGGLIVASGTPEAISAVPDSLTGRYIATELSAKRRQRS
ncbi:MAG: excinuclease ABC subunit UvrA [Candidatus Kapaibacteriota bacterium]